VPQTNPITRRLDRLSMQWLQFVDDAPARVLRWRVRPDEARMVETFLGVENSEGGQMPALFVRLVVPFQAAHTYAFAVRDELVAQIDREAEEDDTLAGFHPPRPRADDHGLVGLRDLSVALVDHVRARGVELDQLVLAILPPSVVDIAGFATFVARLAEALVATDVRAIVLDDRDAPRLDPAVDLAPGRIHTEVADIDMPGAMLEVSARAGGLEEPHGKFRHAYTKMLLAVSMPPRCVPPRRARWPSRRAGGTSSSPCASAWVRGFSTPSARPRRSDGSAPRRPGSTRPDRRPVRTTTPRSCSACGSSVGSGWPPPATSRRRSAAPQRRMAVRPRSRSS
jgi:hypothetical protein